MENNSIAKLILGFLVLIVGIALIGSVAQGGILVTEKTGVSAEALDIALDRNVIDDCPMGINGTYEFTITNAPTGWKVASCPISDFVLYNQTRAAAAVTTDYIFFTNNGAEETSNSTLLSYTYCQDTYLNIAWGRTIVNLVSGFFALALLGVSVGLFYSVAKDTGLIN